MIIPDFQNLYTNRSYLSREQQIRQFRMLLEMLQEHISNNDERNMQISLHGLLYSILSEAAYGETVFMAADILSSQLLAVYLEQLRPDNILVTTELDETMDYKSEEFIIMLKDYLHILQEEMPKEFTIMIFPYNMLEGDFEMWLKHLDNMLAFKGRIIIYDCPNSVPVTDYFHLITDHVVSDGITIKMLQTGKELNPNEINLAIFLKFSKLRKDIVDTFEINVDNHELDRLIYKTWVLEKDIIKYHDEFYDRDIKYNINELKSGLLDIRYSDETDRKSFIQVLRNELLTSLDANI